MRKKPSHHLASNRIDPNSPAQSSKTSVDDGYGKSSGTDSETPMVAKEKKSRERHGHRKTSEGAVGGADEARPVDDDYVDESGDSKSKKKKKKKKHKHKHRHRSSRHERDDDDDLTLVSPRRVAGAGGLPPLAEYKVVRSEHDDE